MRAGILSTTQTPTICFSPPTSRTPNPTSLPLLRSISIATADSGVSAQPSPAAAAAAAETSLLSGRRRLILLRHAESAAPVSFLKDHDRPLSRAGRRDAVLVAKKLQEMGWVPELILSSDATRTKETLQILQENAQGFSEAEVHFVPSFYSIAAMDGQTADHLQKAICEYSGDEIICVMCMGHNRGWEEAASMLSGVFIELKTCNAALLEATGKSWAEAFTSAGLGGWKLHGVIKPEA